MNKVKTESMFYSYSYKHYRSQIHLMSYCETTILLIFCAGKIWKLRKLTEGCKMTFWGHNFDHQILVPRALCKVLSVWFLFLFSCFFERKVSVAALPSTTNTTPTLLLIVSGKLVIKIHIQNSFLKMKIYEQITRIHSSKSPLTDGCGKDGTNEF